jgi:hypothetical protein
MKKYTKASTRLSAKIVQKSSNKILMTIPTDTMEVYQVFQNDYINQVIRQKYSEKDCEVIGPITVVVDLDFTLK